MDGLDYDQHLNELGIYFEQIVLFEKKNGSYFVMNQATLCVDFQIIALIFLDLNAIDLLFIGVTVKIG